MSLLRGIFWFEKGELNALRRKFKARKHQCEARWEATVLAALGLGVIATFALGTLIGLMYCVLCKNAVQALHQKGFFDPML